jgi:hypothetical protein
MENDLIKSARRLVEIDTLVRNQNVQISYKSYDIYPYLRNIIHSLQVQDIVDHEIEFNKELFWIYPKQRKSKPACREFFDPDGDADDNRLLVIGTDKQITSESFCKILRSDFENSKTKLIFVDVEQFKFETVSWYEFALTTIKCISFLRNITKLNSITNQGLFRYLKAVIKFVLHCRQINKKLHEYSADRVLLLVAHYGLEPLIVELKCRNIRVMELQHGVLFPDHFGYNLSIGATSKTLPIPDTFLFYDEQVLTRLHTTGKFRLMNLYSYKNLPLFSSKAKRAEKMYELILFSQPGLIKSEAQILSWLKALLNKISIDLPKNFAVFSHPRERKKIKGLQYVNDEMSYRQALSSCDNAITTSLSVVADATSIGIPILYTDYRNNILETRLLETLRVAYEIYK